MPTSYSYSVSNSSISLLIFRKEKQQNGRKKEENSASLTLTKKAFLIFSVAEKKFFALNLLLRVFDATERSAFHLEKEINNKKK